MSKRSERYDIEREKCEARYNEEYATGEYCHKQSFIWGYEEGYDQAEKDTIERAVEWLNHNAASYTGLSVMFRKAMEED